MKEYNINDINLFLDARDFEKLNSVISEINSKQQHSFKDLQILKTIFESDIISIESKQQLQKLYTEYKKEIEENILLGKSKMPNSITDNEYIKLKPSSSVYENDAFINLKTAFFIMVLIILVILSVTFLTLRG